MAFDHQAVFRCSSAGIQMRMQRKGGGDCRIWQKCHVLDRGPISLVPSLIIVNFYTCHARLDLIHTWQYLIHYSARYHPYSARSHPHPVDPVHDLARFHPLSAISSILGCISSTYWLGLTHTRLDLIHTRPKSHQLAA
jgi:hypothetical protein